VQYTCETLISKLARRLACEIPAPFISKVCLWFVQVEEESVHGQCCNYITLHFSNSSNASGTVLF